MAAHSFWKRIDRSLDTRRMYHRHASIALGFAVSLHLLLVSGYVLWGILAPPGSDKKSAGVFIICTIHPPPAGVSVDPPPYPSRGTGGGSILPKITRASFGIPVAVPVEEESLDLVIPEPAGASGPGDQPGGDLTPSPEDVRGPEWPFMPSEPSPDAFIPVEHSPVPVRMVSPAYPELARRLGIEGTVIVRILVDKEGRARRALVGKTDNSLLDEAARQAALQWLFTPALMNDGPVMVWAAVPFRFALSRR